MTPVSGGGGGPAVPARRFLLRQFGGSLLDRQHTFGSTAPESPLIQFFDEVWQRALPPFLAVVGQTTELLRVHSKLTRHLNVRVG